MYQRASALNSSEFHFHIYKDAIDGSAEVGKYKSPFGNDKGVPDSMQFRRVSVSLFRVTSCASASQAEAGLYAFRFSFTKAALEQSCILLVVAVPDKNRCTTLLRFLLSLL